MDVKKDNKTFVNLEPLISIKKDKFDLDVDRRSSSSFKKDINKCITYLQTFMIDLVNNTRDIIKTSDSFLETYVSGGFRLGLEEKV